MPCYQRSEDSVETSSTSTTRCLTLLGIAPVFLAMALGRSSLLFSWDPSRKTFRSTEPHAQPSGFSKETLAGVTRLCLDCAMYVRSLRAVVDDTRTKPSSPAKSALADAIDKLLVAIQSELGNRGQRVHSILQLQAVVRPVHSILAYFRDLVMRR